MTANIRTRSDDSKGTPAYVPATWVTGPQIVGKENRRVGMRVEMISFTHLISGSVAIEYGMVMAAISELSMGT